MTTTLSSPTRPSSSGRTRKPFRLPSYAPVLLATIALYAVCVVVVPNTVSQISLQAMIPYAAVLAIAAAGQTLVVQQRGIDLSVGGVIGLAAVGVPTISERFGIPTVLAIGIILLVCALVGFANGLLVSRLSITPLVATLAMNAILIGAIAALTGGSTTTAQPELVAISTTKLFGQPLLIWIALIFVIVVSLISWKTAAGRRFAAAGANPLAATVSALSVTRNLNTAYIGAALSYGVAGILLAGYLKNPGNGVGVPYTLSVIATVIVGGTALTGGRGTIVGSAIAALFLTQLVQAVLTLGAPSAIQMLIQAAAIAVAAILQGLSLLGRRRTPRRRADPAKRVEDE